MGTLVFHLTEFASKYPDHPALHAGSNSLTYAQLSSRILVAAARLGELGVTQGDRVVISDPNGLQIPILYFAIHALGAIAVPVSPETPSTALAGIVEDCEAKIIATDRPLTGLRCPVAKASEVSSPAAEPSGSLSRSLLPQSGMVADILYTSGTTGRKKGVVLTHANILAAAVNMTAFIGTSPDDVELVPLPLSHSFGLGRLRCMALVGHTLSLIPGVGNGASLVRSLLASGATGLALVPAGFEILHQMTGDALAAAASHLRYVEIGSAPMRSQTRDWLMRMLPQTRVCHHYGLTEASRAAFTEYHADQQKPGGVGRAAPNVTITICDDMSRPLPLGQTGEVVVQGGMVMREYWRRPELTSQVLCSLGMRTGDLGYLDADGCLFLLGRKDDVINVGGRKVIPDEVEEALRHVEGIRDAACIGVADPLLGQQVKAFVVVRQPIDLNRIATSLRMELEEYKIPKLFELVETLPRTTSGKLQRALIRQGLQETAANQQ